MGSGELLIIAVIGLIVLGPERLPVAIKTISGWIRSAKQLANGITNELNHELRVQELHDNLKKAEQQPLHNLSPELDQTVQELKQAAASVTHSYKTTDNQASSAKNVATDHAQTSSAAESPDKK